MWLAELRDETLTADEAEARRRLIELNAVPDPDVFTALCSEAREARARAQRAAVLRDHPTYDSVAALDRATRDELCSRFLRLADTAEHLSRRPEGWITDALRDITHGRRELWQTRHVEAQRLLDGARQRYGDLGPATVVDVSGDDLNALLPQARDLREHLASGGKMTGLIRPRPVKHAAKLLDHVRVDGVAPTTTEALDAFLAWVDLRRQLDALERLWPETVSSPPPDNLALRIGWNEAEAAQLKQVIDFAEDLAAEEQRLRAARIPQPDWLDLAQVPGFGDLVEAVAAREAATSAASPLEELEAALTVAARWTDGADVITALGDAVRLRDADVYFHAYRRLTSLWRQRSRIARRDAWTTAVDEVTDGLGGAVARSPADPAWDDRLDDFEAAWSWCETGHWLAEAARDDVDLLQRQMVGVEKRLSATLTELTAARAWAQAVGRLGVREGARLVAYVQAVAALGKGTGKYAPHKRREARSALRSCRSSVPAWVMPLYRIAEMLDPDRDAFDVVIIDEASQAGVDASFLMYLAPKIVVVGDDKQVSPSGVGMDQQQLIDLRHQLLHDFEHGRSWENPTTSFFDQAHLRTPDVITLQEHFRCVPEIIGFSNRIAYEPDKVPLIPLRQYGKERLEPIRSVYVPDGYTAGEGNRRVNEPEVDAVVDTVLTCCADARYDGKTMGVISLTGSGQADRIEQELLARMDPTEYKRRNLRCGISPDFQGSERDVVFLSMVAAPSADRRLTALTARSYMQRFNVAASRARDQMWLVHSVTLDELTNREDMRYQLLEYCATVQRRDDDNDDPLGLVPHDVLVEPFDSLFEQHIYNKLYERGYTVVPQWEVYNYRIDLVVVGGGARLAVECDGDRYHGADRFEEDLRRQRELERCGWTFERVRASNFYRDPHAALEAVWERLDELDIRPLVHDEPQAAAEPADEPEPESAPSTNGAAGPAPVQSAAGDREPYREGVRPTDAVPSRTGAAAKADSSDAHAPQLERVRIREAEQDGSADAASAVQDSFYAEQRAELKRLYDVFDERVRTMDGVVSSTADQQALVNAKNARSSIERALRWIDTSSYGCCVACGGAIGRGRLIARPYAERCVDCA